jgi:hypothetical protein
MSDENDNLSCLPSGFEVRAMLMPHSRRRALEEIDEIFADRRPAKASLRKQKIVVGLDGKIVVKEASL